MSNIVRNQERPQPAVRLAALVVLAFLALALGSEPVSTRPARVADGIWFGAFDLGGSARAFKGAGEDSIKRQRQSDQPFGFRVDSFNPLRGQLPIPVIGPMAACAARWRFSTTMSSTSMGSRPLPPRLRTSRMRATQ